MIWPRCSGWCGWPGPRVGLGCGPVLESLVRRVRGNGDPAAGLPVMVAQVRLLADAVRQGALTVDGLKQRVGDGVAWASQEAASAGGVAAWLEQIELPAQLTDRHGSERLLADVVSLVVAGALPRTTRSLFGVGRLVSAALRDNTRLSSTADARGAGAQGAR